MSSLGGQSSVRLFPVFAVTRRRCRRRGWSSATCAGRRGPRSRQHNEPAGRAGRGAGRAGACVLASVGAAE